MNKKEEEEIIKEKVEGNLEFARLKLNNDLIDALSQMVANSFHEAIQLGTVTSYYDEINKGSYQGGIASLITRWNYEKTGILEAWSLFGCRLARTHYFTNGNKRTALLAMRNFIYSCGFHLKDDRDSQTFLQKWEKLLIDIVEAESEELAVELVKERILANIYIEK